MHNVADIQLAFFALAGDSGAVASGVNKALQTVTVFVVSDL